MKSSITIAELQKLCKEAESLSASQILSIPNDIRMQLRVEALNLQADGKYLEAAWLYGEAASEFEVLASKVPEIYSDLMRDSAKFWAKEAKLAGDCSCSYKL